MSSSSLSVDINLPPGWGAKEIYALLGPLSRTASVEVTHSTPPRAVVSFTSEDAARKVSELLRAPGAPRHARRPIPITPPGPTPPPNAPPASLLGLVSLTLLATHRNTWRMVEGLHSQLFELSRATPVQKADSILYRIQASEMSRRIEAQSIELNRVKEELETTIEEITQLRAEAHRKAKAATDYRAQRDIADLRLQEMAEAKARLEEKLQEEQAEAERVAEQTSKELHELRVDAELSKQQYNQEVRQLTAQVKELREAKEGAEGKVEELARQLEEQSKALREALDKVANADRRYKQGMEIAEDNARRALNELAEDFREREGESRLAVRRALEALSAEREKAAMLTEDMWHELVEYRCRSTEEAAVQCEGLDADEVEAVKEEMASLRCAAQAVVEQAEATTMQLQEAVREGRREVERLQGDLDDAKAAASEMRQRHEKRMAEAGRREADLRERMLELMDAAGQHTSKVADLENSLRSKTAEVEMWKQEATLRGELAATVGSLETSLMQANERYARKEREARGREEALRQEIEMVRREGARFAVERHREVLSEVESMLAEARSSFAKFVVDAAASPTQLPSPPPPAPATPATPAPPTTHDADVQTEMQPASPPVSESPSVSESPPVDSARMRAAGMEEPEAGPMPIFGGRMSGERAEPAEIAELLELRAAYSSLEREHQDLRAKLEEAQRPASPLPPPPLSPPTEEAVVILQASLNTCKADVVALTRQLEAKEAEAARLRDQIQRAAANLEATVAAHAAECAAHSQNAKEQARQMEEVWHTASQRAERIRSLESQLRSATGELKGVRGHAADLEERNKRLADHLTMVQATHESLCKEMGVNNKRIAEQHSAKVTALDGETRKLRNQVEAAQASASRAHQEVQQLRTELARMADERHEEGEQAEAERRKMHSEMEALAAERDALKGSLHALQQRMADHERREVGELEQAASRAASVEQANEALKGAVTELQASLEEKERATREVRAQLEAERREVERALEEERRRRQWELEDAVRQSEREKEDLRSELKIVGSIAAAEQQKLRDDLQAALEAAIDSAQNSRTPTSCSQCRSYEELTHALQDNLTAASAEVAHYEAKLRETTANLRSTEEELIAAHNKVIELEERLSKMEGRPSPADVLALRNKLTKSEAQCERLEAENIRQSDRIAQLQNRVKEVDARAHSYAVELGELESGSRAEIADLRARLSSAEETIHRNTVAEYNASHGAWGSSLMTLYSDGRFGRGKAIEGRWSISVPHQLLHAAHTVTTELHLTWTASLRLPEDVVESVDRGQIWKGEKLSLEAKCPPPPWLSVVIFKKEVEAAEARAIAAQWRWQVAVAEQQTRSPSLHTPHTKGLREPSASPAKDALSPLVSPTGYRYEPPGSPARFSPRKGNHKQRAATTTRSPSVTSFRHPSESPDIPHQEPPKEASAIHQELLSEFGNLDGAVLMGTAMNIAEGFLSREQAVFMLRGMEASEAPDRMI